MLSSANNPTPKEIKQFGGLLFLFTGVMALISARSHDRLLHLAVVLAIAWLISLIFNSANRKQQLLGALLPLVLVGAGMLVPAGCSAKTAALIVLTIGSIIAVITIASHSFGSSIYRGWMLAAVPIGWSISNAVLAIVYYLIVTPIGMLMRLVGKDSMNRKFEPQLPSYWIKRDLVSQSDRYFRQF